MDVEGFTAWLEGYRRAWERHDGEAGGDLFTADAVYFTSPFREPWRGRAAIVENWDRDEVDLGSFEFDHELLAVMGDTGVARCWVRYLSSDGASVDQEYSDIWVARFAQDGRCREFIEWFMLRGPETE